MARWTALEKHWRSSVKRWTNRTHSSSERLKDVLIEKLSSTLRPCDSTAVKDSLKLKSHGKSYLNLSHQDAWYWTASSHPRKKVTCIIKISQSPRQQLLDPQLKSPRSNLVRSANLQLTVSTNAKNTDLTACSRRTRQCEQNVSATIFNLQRTSPVHVHLQINVLSVETNFTHLYMNHKKRIKIKKIPKLPTCDSREKCDKQPFSTRRVSPATDSRDHRKKCHWQEHTSKGLC